MDEKQTKNIIIIVVVVLVVCIIGYFVISGILGKGPTTTPKGQSLVGKTVSEIMKLNVQAECVLTGALEKARADRKPGQGLEVITKLLIKGNLVREEDVNIFTDGTEKNVYTIINSKDKTYFQSLLDGSGRMVSLDYNVAGAEQRILRHDFVPANGIDCKASSFDQNILIPQNVCYMPPSTKTPSCSN